MLLTRNYTSRETYSTFMLMLLGLGFWALFAFTPPMSDDLWFAMRAGGKTSDWGQTFIIDFGRAFAYHFSQGDGRLSNLLCMCLLALPRGLVAILSALLVVYTIVAGMRLGGVDVRRSAVAMAFAAAWMVFGQQWRDELLLTDFAINYVWSAALMVLFISMFFNDKGLWPFGVLVGLLLGFFQEGAAVPAGCVCAMWALADVKRLSPRRIAMVISLLPGVCYIVFFSSISQRIGTEAFEGTWRQPFGLTQFVNSLVSFAALYLWVAVEGLLWLRNKAEARRFIGGRGVALMAGAMAGLAIYVVFTYGGRMGYWATVLAVPGLYNALRRLFRNGLSQGLKRTFVVIVTVAATVNLAYSAVKAYGNHCVFRSIVSRYAANPGAMVYYDKVEVNPLLALGKVYSNIATNARSVEDFYGEGRRMRIAPAATYNFDVDALRPIPGGDFSALDNILLYPLGEGVTLPEEMRVCFRAGGFAQTTRIYPVEVTDANGGRWAYCPIGRLAVLVDLFGIEQARLVSPSI